MPYRIIHGWWTECSECGGNARRSGENRHVHGGPDPGSSQGPSNQRSYLDQANGCRALFDEPPRGDHQTQHLIARGE